MKTETSVSELNENISIYDLIAFLGKTTNKYNKLYLTTPKHRLKFNLKKEVYKNTIKLKLGKVHTKTSFSTPRDNVLNFGILFTKRNLKNRQKKSNVAPSSRYSSHSRIARLRRLRPS